MEYGSTPARGCARCPASCLTSSSKTGTSYTYVYDRFGNRWQQNGPYTSLQTFDAKNHNLATDGVTFDAAGNVKTYNNGLHTYNYTYDAENRLITVDTTAGVYTYDAEGRRIRRVVSGAVSDYIYDLAGHPMTEVSSTGTWVRGEVYVGSRHVATYSGGTSGTTYFNFSDWLGSERVRATLAAASCETMTSLPFGDGQTTAGSCADPSPMHFTGKERDGESNLDEFGARYYASPMGRFMIPDWAGKPAAVPYANFGNPQSLNLYSYVENNPTGIADLDGHVGMGYEQNPRDRMHDPNDDAGGSDDSFYASFFNGPAIGAGFGPTNPLLEAQNQIDTKPPTPAVPPQAFDDAHVNNMTVRQVGNVVANENRDVTPGTSSPQTLQDAKTAQANAVMNADYKFGANRQNVVPTAPATDPNHLANTPQGQQALQAARTAFLQQNLGTDPTGNRVFFNNRFSDNAGPRTINGHQQTVFERFGPFSVGGGPVWTLIYNNP